MPSVRKTAALPENLKRSVLANEVQRRLLILEHQREQDPDIYKTVDLEQVQCQAPEVRLP